MRNRYILSAALVLCIVAFAKGQEIQYHNTVPKLGDHKFVLQPLLPGPFIQSTFQTRLGVESTIDLTIPPPDFLPDSIQGFEGNLLFVNLGFQYKQKIKDWMAFYITMSVAVRSGTELNTILFEGVNTLIGGETGLLFNILERDRHKLSGKFMLNNYQGTVINFKQWVEDLLDDVPNASITQNVPALTVGTGAEYAFGITNVTGLIATGELHYGESISRGDESWRFRFGTAVDFNWVDKGVPLGLSVGYIVRSTADYVYVDKKLSQTIALKLAYTAAPDFQIGFEIIRSKVPTISIPNGVTTAGFMLNLQYFFN